MIGKKIKSRNLYRDICRYFINKKKRQNLTNTNFTILSSNCTGGIIYNQLGLRFTSPTINLYMKPSDFVKFCKNLTHYLQVELISVDNINYDYPLGRLDDIILHMVHYDTFEQAKYKWDERKKKNKF